MQPYRQFDIRPGFLFGIASALLVLPVKWFLAFMIAALFHEGFHLLALRILGGQIQQIRIGAGGAIIKASPLPPGRSLICTLAGPLGSLLLLPLARWFPRLVLCAVIQSAYNLLPIGDLDGSHALKLCAELLFSPHTAEILCRIAGLVLLLAIIILGLWCTFILNLGILPLLFAGSLVIKGTIGKIPCKSGALRVQ